MNIEQSVLDNILAQVESMRSTVNSMQISMRSTINSMQVTLGEMRSVAAEQREIITTWKAEITAESNEQIVSVVSESEKMDEENSNDKNRDLTAKEKGQMQMFSTITSRLSRESKPTGSYELQLPFSAPSVHSSFQYTDDKITTDETGSCYDAAVKSVHGQEQKMLRYGHLGQPLKVFDKMLMRDIFNSAHHFSSRLKNHPVVLNWKQAERAGQVQGTTVLSQKLVLMDYVSLCSRSNTTITVSGHDPQNVASVEGFILTLGGASSGRSIKQAMLRYYYLGHVRKLFVKMLQRNVCHVSSVLLMFVKMCVIGKKLLPCQYNPRRGQYGLVLKAVIVFRSAIDVNNSMHRRREDPVNGKLRVQTVDRKWGVIVVMTKCFLGLILNYGVLSVPPYFSDYPFQVNKDFIVTVILSKVLVASSTFAWVDNRLEYCVGCRNYQHCRKVNVVLIGNAITSFKSLSCSRMYVVNNLVHFTSSLWCFVVVYLGFSNTEVVYQDVQMTNFKGRLHWIKTGTLYNILALLQIQSRAVKKTWSFANWDYSRPWVVTILVFSVPGNFNSTLRDRLIAESGWSKLVGCHEYCVRYIVQVKIILLYMWMCTEDRYLICYAAESVFPSPKRTVQHLYIDEELCLGAIMGVGRIVVSLFKDFSWDPFRDYNASDGGGANEYTVQYASPCRGLDITFLYRAVTVVFACHPRCPIFSWHLTPLLDFSCQGFALNTQLQCKHFWQVSALYFSSLMIVVYECDDDSRVYAISSPDDSVHWSILLHDQILKVTDRLLVKDFGCYWPITRDHTYTWGLGNATLLMSINSMTSSENKETTTLVLQVCVGLYTGYSLCLVLQWQIAWCEVSKVYTATSGWYGTLELLFAFDIHVSWYPSEITIDVTIVSTKKASHSVHFEIVVIRFAMELQLLQSAAHRGGHLICVRSLRLHSWSTTTTCVVLGLIVILCQGSMSMFSVYDSRVQIVWLIPRSATWFNIRLGNALALSLMVASLKASQVTFMSLTVWFTCELPVNLALCKGIARNPTPNISWLPYATSYRLENIILREQLVILYNVQVPSILQLVISKNFCVSFIVHPVHWGFSSDRAGLFIWRQIGTAIGLVVTRMISELFAAPMCHGRKRGETRVSTSFLIKPLPLNIILSSKEEDKGGTVLHSWWYNPHILIYTPSSPMKVDSHMWFKSQILANTAFVAMSKPVIQDYLETFDTFRQALIKGGWLIGIQSSSSAASNVVQVLSRVGAVANDSKGGHDRLLADSVCLPFVQCTVSEVRLYTFDEEYQFRFPVLMSAADGTLGGNYTRDEMSATSCDQQEIHIFSSSAITSLKVINAHGILKCSAQPSPIQSATALTSKLSSTSPHHTLEYQQPLHLRPSSPPTLPSILATHTVAAAVSAPTNLVPPHNHTSSSTAYTWTAETTQPTSSAALTPIQDDLDSSSDPTSMQPRQSRLLSQLNPSDSLTHATALPEILSSLHTLSLQQTFPLQPLTTSPSSKNIVATATLSMLVKRHTAAAHLEDKLVVKGEGLSDLH